LVSNNQILRCINKEQQAYREIYEACAPYVYTIIKSYIYDEGYRRDIMQDVFVNIFSSLNKYDNSKGKFKSWISQITINQTITFIRKRQKYQHITLVDSLPENHNEELNSLTTLSRDELESLLQKMPEGYRTVFLLYVIDGYSHKEIGNLLSRTPENSRSQLSRSIKWIRKNIGQDLKILLYE